MSSASLRAVTPREASILACLTDAVVAPEPDLPPVRDTEAISLVDAWLAEAPRLNRLALRAVVYAVELAPRALGYGVRLRRMDPASRARFVAWLEGPLPRPVPQLREALRSLLAACYYGDPAVMRRLGYDADARLRRARELRSREGRP